MINKVKYLMERCDQLTDGRVDEGTFEYGCHWSCAVCRLNIRFKEIIGIGLNELGGGLWQEYRKK